MVIAELKEVHYTYPDGTRALSGVSISVEGGEVVCLVGPNGAGKSTILMILDALIFPQKGEVYLFGNRITSKNAPLVRSRIGLLFQNPDDMLFNPTVIEEVSFALLSRGLSREEAVKRAERELALLRLESLRDRIPHRLSYGQRRLISFASVLVTDPDLLLLDEPTSNLDKRNKAAMLSRLKEFFANKKGEWGAVIATQDEDLEEVCSRTVYIEDGKTIT